MNNKNEIDNIINHLENIKLIFKRIIGDINMYKKNLILYNYCLTKMHIYISDIFYKSVINHLSFVNNMYGTDERLIKNVSVCEKSNIIKYFYSKNLAKSNSMQTKIINVATIDNMSIEKSIMGYKICIGKMNYNITVDIKNIENIEKINDILDDLEISLITNIEFIEKYKNAFLENIMK
jgi:hypothetical protein